MNTCIYRTCLFSAWPVLKAELEKADPAVKFVYVEVGDRPT